MSGGFDYGLMNKTHALYIPPIERLPHVYSNVFHHIQEDEMVHQTILSQNVRN